MTMRHSDKDMRDKLEKIIIKLDVQGISVVLMGILILAVVLAKKVQ